MHIASRKNFACTQCGLCCQGWKIRLGLEEALAWARRGHPIEILLSAALWPEEEPEPGSFAGFTLARSFAVPAGPVHLAIHATLVGAFTGRCPNLLPDRRCAIYEERPVTCRLYPASADPFIRFDPTAKRCPPEAWATSSPGEAADWSPLIGRARNRGMEDVPALRRLCHRLALDRCALATEGLAAYRIAPAEFLRASADTCTETPRAFTMISAEPGTMRSLTALGIPHEPPPAGGTPPSDPRLSWLGFPRD